MLISSDASQPVLLEPILMDRTVCPVTYPVGLALDQHLPVLVAHRLPITPLNISMITNAKEHVQVEPHLLEVYAKAVPHPARLAPVQHHSVLHVVVHCFSTVEPVQPHVQLGVSRMGMCVKIVIHHVPPVLGLKQPVLHVPKGYTHIRASVSHAHLGSLEMIIQEAVWCMCRQEVERSYPIILSSLFPS